MKRKSFVFLAVLLIVALTCQPVLAASTTGSMFSLSSKVAPSKIGFACGTFDISTGTIAPSSSFVFVEPFVSLSDYSSQQSVGNIFYPFDPASSYNAFIIDVPNMSASSGQSWRILLNHLSFVFAYGGPYFPSYDGSKQAPFMAYAKLHWSGTGQQPGEGGSWISHDMTERVDITALFTANYDLSDYPDYPSNMLERSATDLDISVDFRLPNENFFVNGVEYEWRSGSVTSMTIYVVLPFNSNVLFDSYTDDIIPMPSPDKTVTFASRFVYAQGENMVDIFVSSFPSSSGLSSIASSLQQSIGNLGQTMNKSFTEMKTEIKQGATEVKDKIGEQTTEMKKGFTDIVKGITDLPGKIWEKIEEGLTKLIVPDQEKVGGKFDQVKKLAEEKLGILYQVPEMVIDMGKGVVSGVTTPKNTMTLPQFDITVPNEGTFTVWEEYEFEIMPKELDVLKNAIKTITSLIVVIATINSIKRKYESWLNHQ